MSFRSFSRSVFLTVSMLTVSFTSQVVRADAQADFDAAKALYAKRSAAALGDLDTALSLLAGAEAQAQDKLLKYDILILEARTLYFKGTHTTGDANKKSIHSAGQAKADAAEAVSSDYAESAYFAGINLARWGEANGIVSSLTQVPNLKKYMSKAMDRQTRDGNDGESVDGFGPHRTLGRMFKKLPGLFGGSHSQSLKELQAAVNGDKTTALNVVYLGDTLIKDGNDSEKAEGRKLLNELLTQDPNTLNAGRVAENTEEFQLARDVLAGKEIN